MHELFQLCPEASTNVTRSNADIECLLKAGALWVPTTGLGNRDAEIRHLGVSLQDGSRCRKLDVERAACLEGRCVSVGCDDVIGSSRRVDQCGLCGGDGKGCAHRVFRWRETLEFSACDKSCGPDRIRVSVSVCVNTLTDRVVPERLCADQQRPRPKIKRCIYVTCPVNGDGFAVPARYAQCQKSSVIATTTTTNNLCRSAAGSGCARFRWMTGQWTNCSSPCSADEVGSQRREVLCVEVHRGYEQPSLEPVLKLMARGRHSLSHLPAAATTATATEENSVEKRRVADHFCSHLSKPAEVRECVASDACRIDEEQQQRNGPNGRGQYEGKEEPGADASASNSDQ